VGGQAAESFGEVFALEPRMVALAELQERLETVAAAS